MKDLNYPAKILLGDKNASNYTFKIKNYRQNYRGIKTYRA